MSAAEVWFLRAEAALRYNTGDDVENCYKQGVTVSFAQWDANGVSHFWVMILSSFSSLSAVLSHFGVIVEGASASFDSCRC